MAVSKLRFFWCPANRQFGKHATDTFNIKAVNTAELTEDDEQEMVKILRGEGFAEVPDQIAKRLIELHDLGLSPLADLPASS